MSERGERRVIFAEPIDVAEDQIEEEEDNSAERDGADGDVWDEEDDILADIPVKKVRKFDEDEMLAHRQELLLTRNFKLEKEFGAAYTGSTFILFKDGSYGLGLKEDKVNLIEIDTAIVKGTLAEENEDIITFAVSPNQ